MRWRDLRRLLPKVAPAVRFAKPRRMLAMDQNYLSQAGYGGPHVLDALNPQCVPPPKEPTILEIALSRQAQQLERLQQLVIRSRNLADRLLGAIAEKDCNQASTDPGNVVGRLDGAGSMIDRQLEEAFAHLQRLERL
jgi:hypothetical protein